MKHLIDSIGWFSNLAFALSGLPLVIIAIRRGYDKTNRAFLWLWFLGEFSGLFYVLLKMGFDWPLVSNYVVNLIIIGIILFYNYFPREKNL